MKQNKNKYFKFIFLILGLGSFIFTQDNIVDLAIANVDEQHGTFDVLYNSQEDIYSFQINIEGVTLIGVASDLFGMTSFNSETGTIIGLNISQDPAATAGQGILASFTYQLSPNPTSICVTESIISGAGFPAPELPSTTGECHPIAGGNDIFISFGEIDVENRMVEINYASYVDIQGFQLNISGAPITDATNEYLDITFSSATGNILAVDFSGAVIPAGVGNLLILSIDNEDEFDLCINDAIFTSDGVEIDHKFENNDNCELFPALWYDCYNIPLGNNVESDCGCIGPEAGNEVNGDWCDDCADEPHGDSVEDMCETCDSDSSNDCIQDCNDEWGGTAVVDECGVCGGDNSSCSDCCGVPNGDNSSCGGSGDVNGDGYTDVIDVVSMVNVILSGTEFYGCDFNAGDATGDGIFNILDVIVTIEIILGGGLARLDAPVPTSVELIQSANHLSYNANVDGLVGFELTLNHANNTEFILTKEAFIAEYQTSGNTTKMVIVTEIGKELFSSTGDFEIVDVLAGSAESEIEYSISIVPQEYSLSQAYPNPFNPVTTLSFAILVDSEVSLSVYNLQGREVSTLISGNIEAGYHSVVWNANSQASGVYFVKLVAGEYVSTQKLMLIK